MRCSLRWYRSAFRDDSNFSQSNLQCRINIGEAVFRLRCWKCRSTIVISFPIPYCSRKLQPTNYSFVFAYKRTGTTTNKNTIIKIYCRFIGTTDTQHIAFQRRKSGRDEEDGARISAFSFQLPYATWIYDAMPKLNQNFGKFVYFEQAHAHRFELYVLKVE